MADKEAAQTKFPAPWILLLVGLGVPAAAGSQLTKWATANPWTALGLLVAWWVLVGIGGFVLKLWAKREPVVIAWFDERIERV